MEGAMITYDLMYIGVCVESMHTNLQKIGMRIVLAELLINLRCQKYFGTDFQTKVIHHY